MSLKPNNATPVILALLISAVLLSFVLNSKEEHNEEEYVEGYAFCKCLQVSMPADKFDILFNNDCSFSMYWDAVQVFTDSGDYLVIDSLALREAVLIKEREKLERPCQSSLVSDCISFSKTDQIRSLYNGKKWLSVKE